MTCWVNLTDLCLTGLWLMDELETQNRKETHKNLSFYHNECYKLLTKYIKLCNYENRWFETGSTHVQQFVFSNLFNIPATSKALQEDIDFETSLKLFCKCFLQFVPNSPSSVRRA